MQMAGAQPGGAQPDGAQPGGGQPGGEEKTVKLTGVFEDNNVIQNLVVSKDVVKDVVPDKAINLTMVGVTGKEGVSDDDLRANLERRSRTWSSCRSSPPMSSPATPPRAST